MTAEDIAARLTPPVQRVQQPQGAFLAWTLIRRVQVLGDRRDYYEAEADMFEMVRRIAMGRKSREIDPTSPFSKAGQEVERDKDVSPEARKRLRDMPTSMRIIDRSSTRSASSPGEQIPQNGRRHRARHRWQGSISQKLRRAGARTRREYEGRP